MKRFHLAAAAALTIGLLGPAHAADPVQIHLTGSTQNFMAVTEVKGYNCSQYNPCDPSTPAYFSTVSYGNLANGQAFSADMALDLGTNRIVSSSWTSADGKASYAWPDGSVYSYYQNSAFSVNAANNDVLTLVTQTPTKNGGFPAYLSSTYALTFLPGTLKAGAITGEELNAAITGGKLVGATGSRPVDSCQMIQNYWGSACGGRMTLNIASVSNSAVPEPQSWAMLMLGLGLLAAGRIGSSQRKRHDPMVDAA